MLAKAHKGTEPSTIAAKTRNPSPPAHNKRCSILKYQHSLIGEEDEMAFKRTRKSTRRARRRKQAQTLRRWASVHQGLERTISTISSRLHVSASAHFFEGLAAE